MASAVQSSRDWLRSPRTNLLAWWIPQAGILTGLVLPVPVRAAIWITALIWMGTACILNAKRCGRTHCRYTGPYYLGTIAPVLVSTFGIEAQEPGRTGEYTDGVPNGAVRWIRRYRVGSRARYDAHVLIWICRISRLTVFVALTVSVGIQDEWRPTLRLGRIAGLIEGLRVNPAGDLAGAAEPERVIGVITKLCVMRAEAGVDERRHAKAWPRSAFPTEWGLARGARCIVQNFLSE